MNPSYLNTVQGMTQLYEIQSSTEIEVATVGQNKWRYVVKPATLQTMSPTTAPVKGLSSDETFLTGWNVYESQNTNAVAMGIDTTTLPGTYELKPSPDGPVVPGWYYQGGDQLSIFLAWPNQFDGTCA
jgi:hypothetical protein